MKNKVAGFFLTILNPIIYFVAMVVIQVIITIIQMVIVMATGGDANDLMEYNNLMIVTSISMVFGIIVTILYYKPVFKAKIFEKRNINIFMILLSLVIGVSAGYFSSSLPVLIFPNGKPAENPVTEGFSIMTIISVAILAPILEELVFRKFMLDGGKKRGLPTVLIILMSTLLFALSHDPTSIIYFTATFIMGLILAFCYHKSSVILYSMLIHFGNNAMACVSTYFEHKMDPALVEAQIVETSLRDDILFTAGCFVVLALSMFAFCVLAKKNSKKSDKSIDAPILEMV